MTASRRQDSGWHLVVHTRVMGCGVVLTRIRYFAPQQRPHACGVNAGGQAATSSSFPGVPESTIPCVPIGAIHIDEQCRQCEVVLDTFSLLRASASATSQPGPGCCYATQWQRRARVAKVADTLTPQNDIMLHELRIFPFFPPLLACPHLSIFMSAFP